MSETINLSIGRQEVKTEIKKYFLFSVVFLATVVLFTFILIGTNYIFSTRYDKLIADEADLQARIEAQSAKKAKLLLLHERLTTASSIIGKRKNLNEKFAKIISMSPAGVAIESSDISSSLITVGFESANLSSLNDLLNAFYTLDKKDTQIKRVKVNTFGFAKDSANYKLNLDFIF